jgi:transposase
MHTLPVADPGPRDGEVLDPPEPSHGLQGGEAEVIAPPKVPTMPGPEAESDRLDCRRLAAFARKGPLRPVRVPDEQQEADRRVVRLREQLARKLRVIQRPIKAFLLRHGIAEPAGLAHRAVAAVDAPRRPELNTELRFCLDVMLDERRHAVEQVARAARRPEGLAGAQRHRTAVATLRTAPGVGPITAMTPRVERHEPKRPNDGGPVARMLGLAPRVLQSGPRRRQGRPSRSGNARPRTVLIEAARRWVAGDGAAARGEGAVGWSPRPATARGPSWRWPDDARSRRGGWP